ncbi:OmpA family protein [Flavobacterium azooxidireducens]|uniref:OmpA family protein n=1 Tax=Flavobacterium azooxidireducens TaxID=1871076 RepID=A0ABY4KJK4_9FLAO|nr:OmpA family protein [Flavobacterium azooxidireducens]UPQ79585.1 OmpA family protein [Flavobacterium azooxidireducens]
MKTLNCLFIVLFFVTLSAQEKLDIYFDFNKANPNSNSIQILNEWIKNNSFAEVYKMEGYCDTVDSKTYNLKLAERRIHTIENILKLNKIKVVDTIERIPFGENFDFSSNQDENRKVSFFYQKPTPKNSFSEKIKNAKVGELLNLKGLNFYNMSDVVLPNSRPILDELLQMMKDNPTLKIEIQGHICCKEIEIEDISLKRAKTVYDFLLSNAISADRISYKGFASTRPIYPLPEKNEEERVANRRVEILIIEK